MRPAPSRGPGEKTGLRPVTPLLGAGRAAASLGLAGVAAGSEIEPDDPIPGAGTWVRCFTEQLFPPVQPVPTAATITSWKIRSAARSPFRTLVAQLFPADQAAGPAGTPAGGQATAPVLAIAPDPVSPDSCVAALLAAQDAIKAGQLVVITHGPGFTGFFASLHAEHPKLGITVLRVPESANGMRSAQRYAVTERGRFRELVIDVAGRVRETRMAQAPASGADTFPLGPDDVVLVSRGAGGAGLALAQVLACCGAAIAVIGRADPARDSEVVAGLDGLRAAGARVTSEVVDPAREGDMLAAIGRIESKLGPVTALVQGTEPVALRPLAGLTETGLRANVAAQTAGLNQLLSVTTRDRIKLIVTFGSIVSRYGLARGGLLALASGLLASQAEQAAETISGCTALHVDWPAWAGATQPRRPSVMERLARAGVRPIPLNDGSRLLLKMLTTDGFPGRVAVHGRIGTLAAQAETGPAGRFVQAVRLHYPGIELVCEARLSVATDPYLAGYQPGGVPQLPVPVALEAMAQAASVLAGAPVRGVTGMLAGPPVSVPAGGRNAGAVLRICALRTGDAVTVVLRCAATGFAVDHLRAEFTTVPAAAGPMATAALPELGELAASDAGIVDGTEVYGPVCFQAGRFRRAALLPEVTSRSCRALLEPDDDQPWFAELGDEPDERLILGSPGLADATWHVLQACVPHRRLRVTGCDQLAVSGRTADGMAELRAVLTRWPGRGAGGNKPDAHRPQTPAGRSGAGRAAGPRPGEPGRGRDAGRSTAVPAPRRGPGIQAGAVQAAAEAAVTGRAGPAATVPAPRRGPAALRGAKGGTAKDGTADGGTTGKGAADGSPVTGETAANGAAKNGGASGGAGAGGGEYVWDVEALDAAGQPLVTWRGLRLADDGPLPRTGDWPPTLFAAYAEWVTADLGLHPDLRIGVQRVAQDVAARGPARQGAGAPPGALIPRPARPADDAPGAGMTAPGQGALAGYELSVWAPGPAACAWAAADPEPGAQPPGTAGPDLAGLQDDMRSRLAEPPAVLAARLRAVAGCLAAARTRATSIEVAPAGAPDGWVLLRAGQALIACIVTGLSDVAGPVAIAVMTGSPGRDRHRPASGRKPAAAGRSGTGRGGQGGGRRTRTTDDD
jgi:hypothetical protein